MKRILLLDIDNTLNMEDPQPIIEMGTRLGYGKYDSGIWQMFEAHAKDMSILPHPIPYKHYHELTGPYSRIVIITSRLESWRGPTKKWLKKYGFCYDTLLMRKDEDYKQESCKIKERHLINIMKKFKDYQVTAIDDDKSVLQMYYSNSVRTFEAPKEWAKALTYHRRLNSEIYSRMNSASDTIKKQQD